MTTPPSTDKEPTSPAPQERTQRPIWTREPLPQLLLLLPPSSPVLTRWRISAAQLQPIVAFMEQNPTLLLPFETIALSGSFGRMEGSFSSDLDLVILGKDTVPPDSIQQSANTIRHSLTELGLKLPSQKGIFTRPLISSQLFSPPLGLIPESPETFGIRIQLLLDIQPLSQFSACHELQKRILRRYLTPLPISSREECWTFLLTDLGRYFRSLSLKYQWEDQDQSQRWSLRNIKGRFSRPLMHVALITLLGESLIQGRDPEAWVSSRLHLTPLERLASCSPSGNASLLQEVGFIYGEFLEGIANPQIRSHLSEADYRHFLQRAEQFHTRLIDFLLSRREEWPSAFVNRVFL